MGDRECVLLEPLCGDSLFVLDVGSGKLCWLLTCLFAAFSLQVNYANERPNVVIRANCHEYLRREGRIAEHGKLPEPGASPVYRDHGRDPFGLLDSPQVELLRDNTEVGLVTLTNGQDSWTDNGPFGISYPSDPRWMR